MNILFFLTPKSDVAYIEADCTLRQALEKMEYHRYTALPVLDAEGKYTGTLTEGDLLRTICAKYDLSLHAAEKIPLKDVPRRWTFMPVNINCEIEDLYRTAMRQNFVPVVDDKGIFIGIITRKTIMQHACKNVIGPV